MDNTEEFRCISLCTGYAGIELGLRRVIPNLRTVAYVEIEAFACASLVAKIEEGKLDAAPIWTNIKTFDSKPFRDRVHIITGGYPCQPFSVAGRKQGTKDPRHLWPYIEKHIETIRPVWCFFENVAGHLAIGFPEVYRSLQNLGYRVEAGLFTAEEVGAPHRRERLFILANRISSRAGGTQEQGGIQWKEFQQGELDIGDKIRSDLTGGGELVDTDTDRFGEHNATEKEEPKRRTETIISSRGKDVGNTERAGQQSGIHRQGQEQSWRTGTRWPARPSEPQYEWEEPRTIKSCVGGTTDGARSRVDELRLLGNGVVPQTAELAFRTLYKEFV